MPQPTETKSAWEMMVAYFRDFNVLKETRKEYWGSQLINFLGCTFYFALLTIATVFLSEDLKLNDRQAGYSTAIFTSATSLMLFALKADVVRFSGLRLAARPKVEIPALQGRVMPKARSNSCENLVTDSAIFAGCSESVAIMRSAMCGLWRMSSAAATISDR
jgi:hypothetical protein